MDSAELENRFTYHPPQMGQIDLYVSIRKMAKEFALYINENCPDGREKSIAMTKLEECMFWSNSSIARN